MDDNSELVRKMVDQGKKNRLSDLKAFGLLFELEQKIFFRNKEGVMMRVYMALGICLLNLLMYRNIGYDDRGIQNRKG